MTSADQQAALLLAALAAFVIVGIILTEPSSLVAVAALPAIVAVSVIAWGAFRGGRISTLAHLFASVFLIQAVFRIREYDDKDVDFQVLMKIGLWLAFAFVALVHWRRWFAVILMPTNLPWLLFLAWLAATTLVSPSPVYTMVSAFTIISCVIFPAYLFSAFDHVEVFATIVASIALFCLVSIIVYFAIPEFGRYVYWMNEQLYMSPRLAGIAGSANNMALVAAFGLVSIGLFAREFHRLHPLFVPVTAVLTGTALVMTNSRVPLVAAVTTLLISYLLTWRRLPVVLFLISGGLLASAAMIPLGSETLFQFVSRSGDVSEVVTFTGRTDIWYTVLNLIEARPWMGYGYASSVFVLPQHANDVGFVTSHAHNLILQLLLTTGWIGTILFLLSAIGVGIRAAMMRDRIAFAMLMFVLLNGITESSGFTTLANACSLAFAIAVTIRTPQQNHEIDHSYQRGFSRPARAR